MPVITKTTNKVVIRLYGVGLDVVDAFSEDKIFYHSWNEAKHAALDSKQRVFTATKTLDYSEISEV